MSIEPGWYFARRKTCPVSAGLDVVKITTWNGGGVVVWQIADPEPHMTDDYEFGRPLYPDLENNT